MFKALGRGGATPSMFRTTEELPAFLLSKVRRNSETAKCSGKKLRLQDLKT